MFGETPSEGCKELDDVQVRSKVEVGKRRKVGKLEAFNASRLRLEQHGQKIAENGKITEPVRVIEIAEPRSLAKNL